MFGNIDPSIFYPAFALEFGKFAIGRTYKRLTSPRQSVVDAFVLGYYLPWLIFAKGLDESDFAEDHGLISDKFSVESYVFDASTALQLDLDRDYIYDIRSNALVEKASIYQKLLNAKKNELELMAFNLGISLSESIITFNDGDTRIRCLKEAERLVREMNWSDNALRAVVSLQEIYDKNRFDNRVEGLAQGFVEEHKQ